MIQILTFIVFFGLRTSANALDYVFSVPEDGVTACEGSEDMFLDAYFDLSNIEWKQVDDETIMLHGYVIFIRKINNSLHLYLKVHKYSSGRWVETAFHLDRADVCLSLFDPYEIWYDFVKDFEESKKQCPPKAGTKYVFNDKKLTTVIKDLTPGLEGTYRAVLKIYIAEKLAFCMNIEGDLMKKSPKNNIMG